MCPFYGPIYIQRRAIAQGAPAEPLVWGRTRHLQVQYNRIKLES